MSLEGRPGGSDPQRRQQPLRSGGEVRNDLSIRVTQEGDRATLALAGELELATAPMVGQAVVEMLRTGPRELVLDLAELAFMDLSGLRAVLLTQSLCESSKCDFLLVNGTPQVQKLFDITGLTRTLPFIAEPRVAAEC
jgi:anti-anti-sigma factor